MLEGRPRLPHRADGEFAIAVGIRPPRAHSLPRRLEQEGVEDIPGTALHAGINWEWESFPEYLDALETKPCCMDFAAQIAHGPAAATA